MGSTNTIFSANLQNLRKSRGVTQEQLAHYLGVSPQAVSKWENGSYPEGDLLPKISEFFDVSISYLYGQEKEKTTIEQTVYETMREMYGNKDKCTWEEVHKKYIEKMFNIAWAFQISPWEGGGSYYDRGSHDGDVRVASSLSMNTGFSYFNLNSNRQFFTVVSEPEGGFAKKIMEIKDLGKFFKLLGEEKCIEFISFMLSLKWGEYVTAPTIAKNIGCDVEKVNKIIKGMKGFCANENPTFVQVDILGPDGNEAAYGINQAGTCLFIPLFEIADSLINSPNGYQMQIGAREKSWYKREDVLENIRRVGSGDI